MGRDEDRERDREVLAGIVSKVNQYLNTTLSRSFTIPYSSADVQRLLRETPAPIDHRTTPVSGGPRSRTPQSAPLPAGRTPRKVPHGLPGIPEPVPEDRILTDLNISRTPNPRDPDRDLSPGRLGEDPRIQVERINRLLLRWHKEIEDEFRKGRSGREKHARVIADLGSAISELQALQEVLQDLAVSQVKTAQVMKGVLADVDDLKQEQAQQKPFILAAGIAFISGVLLSVSAGAVLYLVY